MLGSMFQGLLQILFRVWTLGVFYFLNNRLFSWIKDSRTLKILYRKIPQTSNQEERTFNPKVNDVRLCLFKANDISWKNLIFMNLGNSKNQGFSNCEMAAMFSPHQKKQLLFSSSYCMEDCISGNSNFPLTPWGIDSEQIPEDIEDNIPQIYSESYCSDLVPLHCFARNFEFTMPSVHKDCFCEDSMQKETAKQENMEYLKKGECFIGLLQSKISKQENMDYLKKGDCYIGLENSIYRNHCCTYKEREKLAQMGQLSKEMYCSPENAFYKDYLCNTFMQRETIQQHKMEDLSQAECIFPKEEHCSSAASIDSGFLSFHSINTTYTCLDINGVTMYLSNIRYNKAGKIIAMMVGFSVEEDSSEESVFSDEEHDENDSDDEDLSDDEDDFGCCEDSDEDFIVFDTEQCPISEQFCHNSVDGITVAVSFNAPCPTFEVQISRTVSPKPNNYFCNLKVDEFEQKCKLKRDRKFNFKNNEQDKTQTVPENHCSAGAVGARRVQFNNDIEVHNIVTWEYAYRQARLGPWKNFATDRLHFQRRIDEVGKVVEPILMNKLATIG